MKIYLMVCIYFTLFLVTYSDEKINTDKSVTLQVALSHGVLINGKKQKIYLKVSLIGIRKTIDAKRNPINLCIILDKSRSMIGAKLKQVKKSSRMILNLLDEDDIISFVTYDSRVITLIPATMGRDKGDLIKLIDGIKGHGSTALFAGVSKGLYEIEKNASTKYVNRIILLSDGMANVGSVSLKDMGDLGFAAAKNNISISTIGIGKGFNEELMSSLSANSDGSYGFAESPEQIDDLLKNEMKQLISVAGKRLKIKIECTQGVKPIKILDRIGTIRKDTITFSMNQIYNEQNKYILVELEVNNPIVIKGYSKLIDVQLNYILANSDKNSVLRAKAGISWTGIEEVKKRSINNNVMEKVVLSMAADQNRMAMLMFNEGNLEKTLENLQFTCGFLIRNNDSIQSTQIEKLEIITKQIQEDLNKNYSNRSKKAWKAYDNFNKTQNSLNQEYRYKQSASQQKIIIKKSSKKKKARTK
ncbi:MAG: hypothetical protein COA79_15385 [Planctomycetota bacterium]|nr:MAG: hypothetical protein COA79_15385 [Planctomycetota bacterium]